MHQSHYQAWYHRLMPEKGVHQFRYYLLMNTYCLLRAVPLKIPGWGRPPPLKKIQGRGEKINLVKDTLRIWGKGGQIQFEYGGLS